MAKNRGLTESEWLACADPLQMLADLEADAEARKTLWLTVACSRRIWRQLPPRARAWVENVEEVAEGRLDPDHLHFGWESYEAFLGTQDSNGHGRCGAILAIAACYWESRDAHEPRNRGWKAECKKQAHLIRDIFGNPFRSVSLDESWRTPTVLALAEGIYNERSLPDGTLDVIRLAVLADALEDAGCTNSELLSHCRSPGPHVRG